MTEPSGYRQYPVLQSLQVPICPHHCLTLSSNEKIHLEPHLEKITVKWQIRLAVQTQISHRLLYLTWSGLQIVNCYIWFKSIPNQRLIVIENMVLIDIMYIRLFANNIIIWNKIRLKACISKAISPYVKYMPMHLFGKRSRIHRIFLKSEIFAINIKFKPHILCTPYSIQKS